VTKPAAVGALPDDDAEDEPTLKRKRKPAAPKPVARKAVARKAVARKAFGSAQEIS
jgi:hypothetical protein